MTGLLRNVIFIVESVEIPDIFQKFSIFLNLENYESIKVGDFIKSELPKGLNFPVLLENHWFENPEFEVEIRKNQDVFAGIFEFQKNFQKSKLSLSGIATLYNVKNALENMEMRCTIVVEEPERRESVAAKETQTVPKIEKEMGIQTDPPPPPPALTDASTNTTGRHISLEDLEPVLTASIARHLQEHKLQNQNQQNQNPEDPKVEDAEVPDPKPSEKVEKSIIPQQFPMDSYNLYPRITKLRDLDKLIVEKSRILADLEVEIELKRKMMIVKEKRAEKLKIDQKVDDKTAEKMENIQNVGKTEKIADKNEKPASESSSKSSTSSDSSSSDSSSSSASSDSSSDSESTFESSESSTTSSSSKSTVKNLEKSENFEVSQKLDDPPILPGIVGASDEKEEKDDDSTIEDPFSARKSPESPTSAYLSQMRNRILEQYSQKYN